MARGGRRWRCTGGCSTATAGSTAGAASLLGLVGSAIVVFTAAWIRAVADEMAALPAVVTDVAFSRHVGRGAVHYVVALR